MNRAGPWHLTSHPEKSTLFPYRAPNATAEFVAVLINDWAPASHALNLERDGQSTIALSLRPQHYENKIILDIRWFCEPGCDHPYAGCSKCIAKATP